MTDQVRHHLKPEKDGVARGYDRSAAFISLGCAVLFVVLLVLVRLGLGEWLDELLAQLLGGRP